MAKGLLSIHKTIAKIEGETKREQLIQVTKAKINKNQSTLQCTIYSKAIQFR